MGKTKYPEMLLFPLEACSQGHSLSLARSLKDELDQLFPGTGVKAFSLVFGHVLPLLS